VTVDADGAGNEALVAAALTPAQARNSSVAAAPAAAARSSLWFHIRLQDHCQTLSRGQAIIAINVNVMTRQ
jgi:hypothetical protein